LCKTYQKLPDDPFLLEMDPVQKMWLYNNWQADQNDSVELAKNHAYLLASFSHPEAVKDMISDANKHISSDEEFEESSKMVRDESLELLAAIKDVLPTKKKRRRKLIK
jgi:hypothetical protein